MAQQKFLVTGATGDTGGYTVEQLVERGHAVRALAQREDDRSKRLGKMGAQVVVGDFLKFNDVRAAMRGVRGATGAEQRLIELGINLSAPPEPFGTYAEAVQTSNLLFLTGMLPAVARTAKFIGRVGAELEPSFFRLSGQLETIGIVFYESHHTDQSVRPNFNRSKDKSKKRQTKESSDDNE